MANTKCYKTSNKYSGDFYIAIDTETGMGCEFFTNPNNPSISTSVGYQTPYKQAEDQVEISISEFTTAFAKVLTTQFKSL